MGKSFPPGIPKINRTFSDTKVSTRSSELSRKETKLKRLSYENFKIELADGGLTVAGLITSEPSRVRKYIHNSIKINPKNNYWIHLAVAKSLNMCFQTTHF